MKWPHLRHLELLVTRAAQTLRAVAQTLLNGFRPAVCFGSAYHQPSKPQLHSLTKMLLAAIPFVYRYLKAKQEQLYNSSTCRIVCRGGMQGILRGRKLQEEICRGIH